MRYAFVNQLSKIAEENQDVVLLTADLGFTVFEEFQKKSFQSSSLTLELRNPI